MQKIQIDCFISVADRGSIKAASGELYLTPQSVSQHIRNLEKELHTPLFLREKTGVSLTEEGIKFYSYAVQWQGLYKHTLRKIHDHYLALASSFSIGVSEYIDVLGNISGGLASFHETHPDIRMLGQQYTNRLLMEKIDDGSLDAGIIDEMQITSGGNFEFRPFAREELHLCISGYHPSSDEDISIKSLKSICSNIPQISTSYGVWSASEWEEISHRMSSYLGYDFETHYEALNFRSCILNLKTIPCSVVCDARFGYSVKDADIISIPLPVKTHLCIFWHKNNENPLIEQFVGHMTAYYKN